MVPPRSRRLADNLAPPLADARCRTRRHRATELLPAFAEVGFKYRRRTSGAGGSADAEDDTLPPGGPSYTGGPAALAGIRGRAAARDRPLDHPFQSYVTLVARRADRGRRDRGRWRRRAIATRQGARRHGSISASVRVARPTSAGRDGRPPYVTLPLFPDDEARSRPSSKPRRQREVRPPRASERRPE